MPSQDKFIDYLVEIVGYECKVTTCVSPNRPEEVRVFFKGYVRGVEHEIEVSFSFPRRRAPSKVRKEIIQMASNFRLYLARQSLGISDESDLYYEE